MEQWPLEGVSIAYSFADADAPTRKQVQYFENFGQRAIWADGWKAIFRQRPMLVGDSTKLAEFDWELYDLERDPTECHDVAAEHPDLVKELEELWWVEADKYHVLPLRSEITMDDERPRVSPGLDRYVYWPGTMVPETEAVNVKNRSHRVTVDLELQSGDEGALVSQGTRFGGWTLFVQDGHLHHVHNFMGRGRVPPRVRRAAPDGDAVHGDVRVHPHRRARGRRPAARSTARSSPRDRSRTPCPAASASGAAHSASATTPGSRCPSATSHRLPFRGPCIA